MDSEDLPVYSILFAPNVEEELTSIIKNLQEYYDEDFSEAWEDSFHKALAILSHTPYRAKCERESKIFQRPVYSFVHRRKGSPPYTVYFFIIKDPNLQQNYGEVQLFHIRQSSRKPFTLKEAKNMKSRFNSAIEEN
jgi:hypothetical protein